MSCIYEKVIIYSKGFFMKNFLIFSALLISFPYSLNADKKLDATHVGIGVAAILIAGGSFYYYKTRYNMPSNNPSLTPQKPLQQEQYNEPDLGKLLQDPQPSDPAPHTTHSNTPQPAPQTTKPTSTNTRPTKQESTTGTTTQKQPSLYEELYRRIQESEIENEAKRLLTEHAFSN